MPIATCRKPRCGAWRPNRFWAKGAAYGRCRVFLPMRSFGRPYHRTFGKDGNAVAVSLQRLHPKPAPLRDRRRPGRRGRPDPDQPRTRGDRHRCGPVGRGKAFAARTAAMVCDLLRNPAVQHPVDACASLGLGTDITPVGPGRLRARSRPRLPQDAGRLGEDPGRLAAFDGVSWPRPEKPDDRRLESRPVLRRKDEIAGGRPRIAAGRRWTRLIGIIKNQRPRPKIACNAG